MTNREVLWRSVKRSHLLWLSINAVVLAVLILLPRDFSRLVWIPLAALAIAIPYGYLMVKIRCPNCAYPFDEIGLLRIKLGSSAYHCPHCGIGLDQATAPSNSCKVTPDGASQLDH